MNERRLLALIIGLYLLIGGGYSVIHLLSIWTLISVTLAIYFIRRGNRSTASAVGSSSSASARGKRSTR